MQKFQVLGTQFFCSSNLDKVQILWEGHKIWKNFPSVLTKKLLLLSSVKTRRRSFQIFVAFSEKLNFNRTRCRSLVMLYYLYTMRRWLSHSGVELPCLVFTTAQRCQSIYKVAFLFCQCEFAFHLYYSKNHKNDKI